MSVIFVFCIHLYEKTLRICRCLPHLCERDDISTHTLPSQPQNGSLANTQS